MTRIKISVIAIAVMVICASAFFLIPRGVHSTETAETEQTELQKRQEIWISALEWCESRGKATAVNPKDRDGTPSYGAFQFKPGTFYGFSEKYGFPTSTPYLDREQQLAIVRRMINDPDISNSELRNRQFPDCIQRFVGLPPRQ